MSKMIGEYTASATSKIMKPLQVDANGFLTLGSSGGVGVALHLDALGNLYVNQASLLPGEDAVNDWRKVKVESVAVFTPAATAGTAVTAAGAVVLASTQVLGLASFSIQILNAGGGSGDDLTDVDVEVSQDGTNWVDADALRSAWELTADILGGGESAFCFVVESNSIRYVRVTAYCGAGNDTTVDLTLAGRIAA